MPVYCVICGKAIAPGRGYEVPELEGIVCRVCYYEEVMGFRPEYDEEAIAVEEYKPRRRRLGPRRRYRRRLRPREGMITKSQKALMRRLAAQLRLTKEDFKYITGVDPEDVPRLTVAEAAATIDRLIGARRHEELYGIVVAGEE